MLARCFLHHNAIWGQFYSDKMPFWKTSLWQNASETTFHIDKMSFCLKIIFREKKNYFVPALSGVRGECWQGHNTLYIFIELHHYESRASLEKKKVSGCLVAHIVDVKLFWINNSSSAMTKAGRKKRFFKCFLVLQSGLHTGYFFCHFQNALVCNDGIMWCIFIYVKHSFTHRNQIACHRDFIRKLTTFFKMLKTLCIAFLFK